MPSPRRPLVLSIALLLAAACQTGDDAAPLAQRDAPTNANDKLLATTGAAGADKVEIAPMATSGSDTPGDWQNADGAKLFDKMIALAQIKKCEDNDLEKLIGTTKPPGGIKYRKKSKVLQPGGERATFGYFIRVTKGDKKQEFFVLFSFDRIKPKDKDWLCASEVFVFGPLVRGCDGKVSKAPLIEGLAVAENGTLLDEVPLDLADRRLNDEPGVAVKVGVAEADKGCRVCHAGNHTVADETNPFPWGAATLLGAGTTTGEESGSGETGDACDSSSSDDGSSSGGTQGTGDATSGSGDDGQPSTTWTSAGDEDGTTGWTSVGQTSDVSIGATATSEQSGGSSSGGEGTGGSMSEGTGGSMSEGTGGWTGGEATGWTGTTAWTGTTGETTGDGEDTLVGDAGDVGSWTTAGPGGTDESGSDDGGSSGLVVEEEDALLHALVEQLTG